MGANAAVLAETVRAGAESLFNPDLLRRTNLTYSDALGEIGGLLARGLRA